MKKGIFAVLLFLTIGAFPLSAIFAANIGLQVEVKKVNEPSTYYTWLTVNNITGTSSFKAYRDGTEFDAKFTFNKNNNTYLGSDTYPSEGNHTYKVVVYDGSSKSLGEGSKTVTVPKGSYIPPDTSIDAPLVDIKDIDLPKSRFSNLEELFEGIAGWLIGLVGIIATIAIAYSGIIYLTSGSDATKAEAAKKNLTWAIIGLVLAVLAIVIINLVTRIAGG